MHSAHKAYTSMPKPYKIDQNSELSVGNGAFSDGTLKQVANHKAVSSLRIAKAIFIGDAAVGKTSLVMRYTHNAFDMSYKATIGVDFEVEKYSILDVPFTLQMWDTAGSERFQCIASAYYRGANTVVICFDFSRIETLNTTRKWLDQAIAENPKQEFLLFLVGLKRDIVSDETARSVESQAVEVAKNMNAEYWSVSAADNFNIDELFSRIACLTFDNILTREDKMQSEKKVISPVKPSVPRKITLDDDFRKKTGDEQQNSCAFNSKCA